MATVSDLLSAKAARPILTIDQGETVLSATQRMNEHSVVLCSSPMAAGCAESSPSVTSCAASSRLSGVLPRLTLAT